MDIQVSSNFERLLFEVHGRDPDAVRRLMAGLAQSGAFTIGDRELQADPRMIQLRRHRTKPMTADTIRETLAATGELLDPHTAVGYAAARRPAAVGQSDGHAWPPPIPPNSPMRSKRPAACGPVYHSAWSACSTAAERFTVLPNDAEAVRDFIRQRQVP